MTALKKLYFGETFINGMQLLLRNQESWITNGGTTTKDFKLEKGIRQRDLISAYLFIVVLEIALFTLSKIQILMALTSSTIYSYILLCA